VLVLVFFEVREQVTFKLLWSFLSAISKLGALLAVCLLIIWQCSILFHYAVLVAYVARSSDTVSHSLGTPLYVHHFTLVHDYTFSSHFKIGLNINNFYYTTLKALLNLFTN
jgi:hypothetical protein